VLKLGQFDLQLSLVTLRTLRKNIQYQAGTVQHAALEALFEVALLGGGEVMIEDHERDASLFNDGGNLIHLAGTSVKSRVWAGPLPRNYRSDCNLVACGELM
jgi:hypothetical protein